MGPFSSANTQMFQVLISTWIVDRDALMDFDITIKARCFSLVRIYTTTRWKHKPSIDMYIGERDAPSMNPSRLRWKSGKDFCSYTFAIGRKLL